MGSDAKLSAPSIPLMNKKTTELLGYLDYEFIELENKQKRLIGRKALKPVISIDDYTTRAVIDWIEIKVLLNRKTQFRWLQADIEKILNKTAFVENSLQNKNAPDDLFVVRIQEPEIETLRAALGAIKNKYGLGVDPLIIGIEISVDFYPKKQNVLERAKMVRVLTNHLLVKPDMITDHRNRPRAVWGRNKGDYERLINGNAALSVSVNRQLLIDTDWDSAPYADATFVLGDKEADARWRVMDKVIDTQNITAGTHKELAAEDKRARIEVTLNEAEVRAIGLEYFDDLKGLSFASLQGKYFRFFLPTTSGRVIHKTVWREAIAVSRDRQRLTKFRMSGGVGLKAMDDARAETQNISRRRTIKDIHNRGLKLPARERVATGTAGSFVAYEEMNARVLTALNSLGKRVAKGFSD